MLTNLKNHNLARLGEVADEIARDSVMAEYMARKAKNTIRRHVDDLAVFAHYLKAAGATLACEDFQTNPNCWQDITWGIIKGFVAWQVLEGYAIGTINARLTTVKTYAKLAHEAGAMESEQYLLIKGVSGYSRKEGVNLDTQRPLTRKVDGNGKAMKKAQSIVLSAAQVKQLLNQPDTEQGRRDVFLLQILFKLGLRCGEVAGLRVRDFDLAGGYLAFRRPKVDKVQTHKLDRATLAAAKAYFKYAPAEPNAPVFRSSRKSGKLTHAGMSERAITKRVKELGQRIGVEGLSAHDCRHTWATLAARSGASINQLQDAGGWNSLSGPLSYIERAKIANVDIKLTVIDE